MAYNNYYPQFYPSAQPNFQQTQQVQHSVGMIWVQGENSAKAYPVSAGNSIPLFDSENPVIYIKSVDQSGMPLPLRIFDYTERSQMRPNTQEEQKTDYISRSEFNAFKDEIKTYLSQPNSSSTTTTKTVQSKKREE